MVSCHSSDMHQQDSGSRVMAHVALPVRYNDCGPPIRFVASLGEGRGTLKTLYLILKLQVTQLLEKSKNLHHAGLEMAIGTLIEFEG